MTQKFNLLVFLLVQFSSQSLAAGCGRVPSVENADFAVESDATGTRVAFRCTRGLLIGSHVLSCNASRQWHEPPPVCREACGLPKRIQNAQLKYPHYKEETFPAHHRVAYECVHGFKRESGEPFATCRQDFTWEEASLTCVLNSPECQKPDVPNGQITSGLKSKYVPNDAVTLRCLPGFLPEGHWTSVCGRDEMWAPGLPKCAKREFTHCGVKLEDWKAALENEKRCLEKQKAELERKDGPAS
ncbi:membrane cofactor protein-like [Ambystoma mexicanum]|uniref:membrane cofactor protein-like n=1 Tax=Ambystoma mexicanum TaxID=8296 RepID=UPI0037E9A4C7